jgi:hypothetical protein
MDEEQKAKNGDTLSFTVYITSNPGPHEVRWLKGSKQISDQDSNFRSTNVKNTTFILFIHKVSSDGGGGGILKK